MYFELTGIKKSPLIPGKRKPVAASKSDMRLERLREWQKAKRESKAKEAGSCKPTFAVRHINKSVVRDPSAGKTGNANSSVLHKTSFSTKKAVLCMSPKPARPSASSTSKLPNSSVTSSSVSVAAKPPATSAQPKNSIVIERGKKTEAPVSKQSKTQRPKTSLNPQAIKPEVRAVKKKTTEAKSSRAPTAVRHSSRLASMQTVSSSNKQVAPKPAALKPARASASAATRNTSNPGSKTSTRRAATKRGGRNISNKSSPADKNAVPKSDEKKKKKKRRSSSASRPEQLPPISSEGGMLEDQESSVVPSTPVKKYEPICPSPLLHSRSASRQLRAAMCYRGEEVEGPYLVQQAPDDPAWIPGAPLPDDNPTAPSKPDFEGVFGGNDGFSPFRFTAGTTASPAPGHAQDAPFQFSFRMELKPSEGLVGMVPCSPHSPQVNTSLGLEDCCRIETNASASEVENLITFSDNSVAEEVGEEPGVVHTPVRSAPDALVNGLVVVEEGEEPDVRCTPRRSARNTVRKNYNYTTPRKRRNSQAVPTIAAVSVAAGESSEGEAVVSENPISKGSTKRGGRRRSRRVRAATPGPSSRDSLLGAVGTDTPPTHHSEVGSVEGMVSKEAGKEEEDSDKENTGEAGVCVCS